MASGYDISASTSTSTATNSAAGPATSGGVSVGNVTVGGAQGTGLFFSAPASRAEGVTASAGSLAVLGVVALGAFWFLSKRKA